MEPDIGLALLLAPEVLVPAAHGQKSSPERTAAMQRTVERRRRLARGARPVGAIVARPMPSARIIRQTPAMHDEIRDLLRLLRGGP